jgi:hypothetical protein
MFVANDSKSSSVISVKKQELVDAITKNYKEHRSIFEQAQKGYRAAVIAELDKMLADARAGREVPMMISLIAPSDHSRDYERTLRMLSMCTADVVFVDEKEFAQFVMDDWQWKRDWFANASSYTGQSR